MCVYEHTCRQCLYDMLKRDSGKQFDVVILLDISKAFDIVPHRDGRLLGKLYHYGIKGNLLRWIEAFLVGRTQFAEIHWRLETNIKIIHSPTLDHQRNPTHNPPQTTSIQQMYKQTHYLQRTQEIQRITKTDKTTLQICL